MKASLLLSGAALLGLASATPMTLDLSEEMIDRLKAGSGSGPVSGVTEITTTSTTTATITGNGTTGTGTTANEFLEHGCRPVIFIFARGSYQDGNIGISPGPQTIAQLKARLGGDGAVAAQGLDYPAELLDNLRAEGCDPVDVGSLMALVARAAGECPDSKLVLSGYSQGAALVHAAARRLGPEVIARVAAAVTYGDTRKEQDRGLVPGIDPSRSLILCHDGDLVCDGTLIVTDYHYDYDDLAPTAVEFIAGKV
ncbi:carbohydrate esterase family 5 protein [Nemania sp. NC0429]|nr:carbohydrate esterase family 5 protein [Nemania sp. NC0429]